MHNKHLILVFTIYFGIAVCRDPICPYPSDKITFFPFPGDCTKYIECYEGTRYNMTCPPDLFWNQYVLNCDYECNGTSPTPSPSNKCPASGISYLPNYADCTKYFQCDNGQITPETCQNGYAWNIIISACDEKELVDCSFTTISPPNPTTPSPSNRCPASGISYLPNYADCTKYFQCDNGKITPETCQEGYAWNIIISACDEKELVDCSFTTITPPNPTTNAPNNGCPASGLSYLPNDEDCTKYFRCYNGQKTSQTCANGYAWNVIISACDLKDLVNCNTPDNGCPSSGLSYLPNYADCTKYFQCYNGQKTGKSCPNGYAWNIIISACDDKDLVDCSFTTVTPPTTTTKRPDSECPATGVKYFADYADCTKFYQCFNGVKSLLNCPTGYSWDINNSQCRLSSTVDCSYITGVPIVTTSGPAPDDSCYGRADGTLLPYPSNCRKFVECAFGKSVVFDCPKGTSWNNDILRCDTNDAQNCR